MTDQVVADRSSQSMSGNVGPTSHSARFSRPPLLSHMSVVDCTVLLDTIEIIRQQCLSSRTRTSVRTANNLPADSDWQQFEDAQTVHDCICHSLRFCRPIADIVRFTDSFTYLLTYFLTKIQRPTYFGDKWHCCKLGVRVRKTPKSPLPVRGPGPLCNTMLLWTTRSLSNGMSPRPTALAGYATVTDDIHTYRRTDHATVTSVAIGRIAFSDAANTADASSLSSNQSINLYYAKQGSRI